jgi:anaerobic dimethyl sulfoxide reductase subunit B (iron-sulfur subunit)
LQLAFYFDQTRCTGCHTCVVACKDWHDLPAGGSNWRRVTTYEEGKFPNVKVSHLSISCAHCAEPACAEVCPEDAIYKRKEDGVVLIDAEKCTGCQVCESACEYGAIQFRPNGEAKAEKCNFCVDRLEKGEPPICVSACPMRALDFGSAKALASRPGVVTEFPNLPAVAKAGASLYIKPKS